MRGQDAILQQSEELCLREAPLQRRLLRARADDDLRARKIEREECFEVLFDRDTPHGDEDGARKAELDRAIRPEQVGINAARPHPEVGKPALAQLEHERWRRHHRHSCGGMESSQRRVNPRLRDRHARRDVFRKARRVAGGEGPPVPSAIARHHMADRSFGCDMDRVRLGRFDAASDLARTRQRQPQSGVGRYRNARKTSRGEEFDVDAQAPRAVRQRGQGADHAVDLRVPRIRCDQNPHQAALGGDSFASSSSNRM